MATIKELKVRIKSINNTAKITHAMELVAAAKMKKAQDIAAAGKPYSNLVNNTIRSIASKIDQNAHLLLARSLGKSSAVIFFSTNRGLAGSLNSNLFKELETLTGETKFITVGKKARNYIAKTGKQLIADFPLPEKPTISDVRPLAKLVIDGFLNREFDQVYVLFSEFVTTLRQETKLNQLLPIIDAEVLKALAKDSDIQQTQTEPLFEPDPDTVLEAILPQYILMELYQILLEAKASEHSARMIAMKNATDNAKQLADDFTLTYNGIRQDTITKEILDITTAAIALE